MTEGSLQPPDPRRVSLLDDREPPRRVRLRWMLAAGVMAVAVATGVALALSHGSSSSPEAPSPSASAPVQLPPGARPLPGVTDGAAGAFGVLGRERAPSVISRSQALRRYDTIDGAASRIGRHRQVFTALVRAAFISRGHVQRGSFWVVSVWSHPPDIGVSPQHQWCVTHGLVNATTGNPGGYAYGCLPRGTAPQRVR